VDIYVEDCVLADIQEYVSKSVGELGINKPNLAKIVGTVVFRIHKLKPISYRQFFLLEWYLSKLCIDCKILVCFL
jgi:hypothetical protein